MTTLKGLFAAVAVLISTVPAWADVNFSLTGYGQYSRRILNGNTPFATNGLGGTLLAELEPEDFFSIGVGYHMTGYVGINAPGEGLGSVDGVVRLMPWGTQPFSPYLMGTFGLNPFGTDTPHFWPATRDFSIGAGFRYFVLPQWAADFGASFRDADASGGALQSIDLHTGLSFFVNSPFQHPDKMVWAGGGVTIMQPVTITETGQDTRSLQDIAKDEYGDPKLYPLIVDANFADKSKPLILPPGMQLIIPQHPTGAMAAAARVKAETPTYQAAAETFRMPELDNLQYRLEPAPSEDTEMGGRRDHLTFQADSLWDIAARPDVYGDPELYPLLVDANFKRLSDPLLLQPGTKLTIPRHPTERQKRMARIEAWTVDYIRWRGVDVTEAQYREWRKEKGLPPVDEVTGEVSSPQPADGDQ